MARTAPGRVEGWQLRSIRCSTIMTGSVVAARLLFQSLLRRASVDSYSKLAICASGDVPRLESSRERKDLPRLHSIRGGIKYPSDNAFSPTSTVRCHDSCRGK